MGTPFLGQDTIQGCYDYHDLLPKSPSRTELAPPGNIGHNSALSTVICDVAVNLDGRKISRCFTWHGEPSAYTHSMISIFILNFGHHVCLCVLYSTAHNDIPLVTASVD